MNIENLLSYVIYLIALKSVCIGSEFSFHKWIKHGKLYTSWYHNRETFEQFHRKQK